MSAPLEPLVVIGAGHVGLVTAAGFAAKGHEVWCVEVQRSRLEALTARALPFYEPQLAETIKRAGSNLHFTASIEEALSASGLRLSLIHI